MASGEAETTPTTDEYVARTRVGEVRVHNYADAKSAVVDEIVTRAFG
jgi:hypothetical protein